ncbi:MAG: hypothetical protein K6G81_05955 [Lachnospiraceae bacterium]|nr:hypothetical protein [Lachnospiraceae bacterium]
MRRYISILVAAAVVIIAVTILGFMLYRDYQEKHRPSDVVMPLSEYYSLTDDEGLIIIDETVYEKRAAWRNGTAYLDLNTVLTMYDHRFFWVEQENTLFYSMADVVYRFTPGKAGYLANREPAKQDRPVVELIDHVPYIRIDFLERCGITYRLYTGPNRVMITYSDEPYLTTKAKEATQIRVGKDIKESILKEVAEGENLRYIDGGGVRENGFIKVMSDDGVRGYIKESALGENGYTDPSFMPHTEPAFVPTVMNEPVYLGWQLLYTKDNVGYLESALSGADEVNVVSPTWFFLTGTDGSMISYANREYVEKAHAKGVKVWALYKNDTIEGQFSGTEDSHRVLSNTEARTALIDNIMNSVAEYGIDGVNIDFEMLKVDSGPYFIQFLRELSIECRRRGIILSVDNYVPENYNVYYDLAEQSYYVDYIIIMGYDEHYSGSDEAGSVSSLAWFKRAIENTAIKADPKRVIMGVPFYSRLWKTEGGKPIVEATPLITEQAGIVKKAGASASWSDSAGQNYAEWKSGSALYQIWIEDEESLTEKVKAVKEAGMAGIAAWKLGDEKQGIWKLISDTFEGR